MGNYFKEFLMLFLAVFCGFLAENYREERQEEEAAMATLESLCRDLKRDSVQLESAIRDVKGRRLHCDSLEKEILGTRIETNSGPAFKLLQKIWGFADFTPNEGSIQQLNSNGLLRIVKDKEILDQLTNYQADKTILRVNEGNMNRIADEIIKLKQHFDLLKFAQEGYAKPIPLLQNDKQAFNQLYERISSWNKWFSWLEKDQVHVQETGAKLRKAILNHYPKIKTETSPE